MAGASAEKVAATTIMDQIYSVGSVLWNGQRRFVEYHGGMHGSGKSLFWATDGRTGMHLEIPYDQVAELGWKRMPADRWAAETGLKPPKSEHGSMADPWWLQRERDPIVRFCDQYQEAHPKFGADTVTRWTEKSEGRERNFLDDQWLVRTAARWSWSVYQGERLVDLLMDLFVQRIAMSLWREIPSDFDWSAALEGSGYGDFARALLKAAEGFESESAAIGPPEQLGLF